ncbi:MAG: hypothetical protein AB1782_05790 [Cyanobacteriota bacterium]
MVHQNSTITLNPGVKFYDILTHPENYGNPTIPPQVQTLINNIGNQVTTIGDAISTQNVDMGSGIMSQKLSLPDNSGIDTRITQSILNNYVTEE